MAINIGYFGLSLNTSNLSGNPFMNCFLSATTEVPAYVVSTWLLRKCPRRALVSSFLAIGGGVLLLIQFIPDSKTSFFVMWKCSVTSNTLSDLHDYTLCCSYNAHGREMLTTAFGDECSRLHGIYRMNSPKLHILLHFSHFPLVVSSHADVLLLLFLLYLFPETASLLLWIACLHGHYFFTVESKKQNGYKKCSQWGL